ncbi:S8 family serine peptidase [Portibacter marinus]|uniref:S8 family serine peptidase n=1 Tax=Portibacter marinus TaxID=2898660 RepID=UPI001F310CCC|nr:S8 family serine peptidase [Portibacter marinus]
MKLVLVIPIIFSFIYTFHAQQLTHRQGQVLVELKKGQSADEGLEFLQNKLGINTALQAEMLIEQPMNVWKIKFDHAQINQIRLLQAAKEVPYFIHAQNNHFISQRVIPDDPDFTEQWQYINVGDNGGIENADLDIDEAWNATTGGITSSGDTIVVCVIDDGLDPEHEDFGDNVWINYNEIPDNNIDDDNNGYIDDYFGWDTYNNNGEVYQGGGHGTPVTGIIGAQGNNGIGVTGVNWDVQLMIVRGGGVDEASALSAYAYPYIMRQRYNESNGSEGAFVVATNSSWGIDFGQVEDAPLWCNFYDSLGMVGILNCGATINAEVDVDVEGDLPTSCTSDFLISVSNVNRSFEKEEASGFGVESIDLGAFGTGTYTTRSGNGYGFFDGTSAATPHVTGAVALLYALPYPELSNLAKENPASAARLIKNIILGSVRKDDKFNDLFKSGGVLNLKNAVELMGNIFSECSFPLTINVDRFDLDSTTVSWSDMESADSYDLRYKKQSDTLWTEVIGVASPFTISQLDDCEIYEVQVRSVCSTDTTSDYSFSFNFESLGCCRAPEGLLGENDAILVDENAILLSWNPDLDHDSYSIEYNVVGSNAIDTVTSVNNFILLEDLAFCEAYEFRVVANCITGELTPYSEVFSATTACGRCSNLPYCLPPPLENFGEWIESVTLDGQLAETGEDFGYGNYAGFFDLDLRVGTEIELKVNKGFTDISFEEWVKVWIDINVDGMFSDDELVFDEGEATENNIDTTIIVQGDVSPGLTRMRVGMVYLDEPIPCEDPDVFLAFGEYEDYCVNLIGPCDYGLDLISIDPGMTDANVTYSMVDTSIAYNLRYKEVDQGDDDWNTISVLDTMAMISDLTECTAYVLQLRAVCLVDTSGFEAVSDTFFTLGDENCMVNVEDFAIELFDVKAAPNPFISELSLNIQSQVTDDVVIQVYNISGQKIHRSETRLSSGHNVYRFNDSSSWMAGVYLIRIQAKQYHTSQKVIKLGR